MTRTAKARGRGFERIMGLAVRCAVILTLCVLIYIICFILAKGVPNLKPSLFAWKYTSENVSLTPALVTTLMMVGLTLLIAAPLGVFSAIYLVEYAKRGNRAVGLVRITTETLAGIPSIVYALFGRIFFVVFMGWGFSMIAGASTLAIMILPLIMRAAEEAIKAVPDAYREGAFGLGAGKLRTVFKIVLPAAMPGIFSGIILAIGRIVGETAALLYTSGSVARIPTSLTDSAETLSVHMFRLAGEGLHVGEAYATAVVLLAVVVLINALSGMLAKKMGGSK